jgi:hypothetical protein
MDQSTVPTRFCDNGSLYGQGLFSNFGLYWKVMWTLRLRQRASYFILTFAIPLLFVVIAYVTVLTGLTDLEDDPTPKIAPVYDARNAGCFPADTEQRQ